jgi:hypothetical protein
MSDAKFYKEIQFLFESYLSPKRDKLKVRVKDLSNDTILEHGPKMNYDKVFFDSELNIYRLDKDGKVVKVDNDNFEAVVMRAE